MSVIVSTVLSHILCKGPGLLNLKLKTEDLKLKLCETLQKFSLPLKYLLSLSSDGPNVNKAIKTNINRRLQVNYQRELVDTGPCQLHVVHNSFRKGVEGYSSDVENLCIDIYYFFKL